jgi:MFS family permease
MRFSRDFIQLTFADFIVRSAYQMGKTPLLPIFAAALGATDLFLGIIVSVSTVTGLVLKPFIGVLSDRWGRRLWLLIGTLFFVVVPFFYWLVKTPEQLFVIRIIHGVATAIYGPVTFAYIAERTPDKVAQSLGWFGLARSGGYIVGPALAGWLLLSLDPATIFTIIGFISVLALLPILRLPEPEGRRQTEFPPILKQIRAALAAGSRTPGIWLSGGLETGVFIALYTIKAFLPVYGLSVGINVALIGLFFSLQEAVHIFTGPLGGWIGQRYGPKVAIQMGIGILACGIALVPHAYGMMILGPSLLLGLAQSLIFPSTAALVTQQIPAENLGAGMGLMGMMENLGKVIGPVICGFLIGALGFEAVLYLLAVLLMGPVIALGWGRVRLMVRFGA